MAGFPAVRNRGTVRPRAPREKPGLVRWFETAPGRSGLSSRYSGQLPSYAKEPKQIPLLLGHVSGLNGKCHPAASKNSEQAEDDRFSYRLPSGSKPVHPGKQPGSTSLLYPRVQRFLNSSPALVERPVRERRRGRRKLSQRDENHGLEEPAAFVNERMKADAAGLSDPDLIHRNLSRAAPPGPRPPLVGGSISRGNWQPGASLINLRVLCEALAGRPEL